MYPSVLNIIANNPGLKEYFLNLIDSKLNSVSTMPHSGLTKQALFNSYTIHDDSELVQMIESALSQMNKDNSK